MQAFCQVLCGNNLLYSLSLPSLKQHALVKIAERLLSRDHTIRELIDVMKPWYDIRLETDIPLEWHQEWLHFRRRISADIDRFDPLPDYFKRNVRGVVMCLLRDVWNFPKPEILNPVMKLKFDARGALDTRWMFEDYAERTFQTLPAEEKLYELLYQACSLYQDGSVQSILCELLKDEMPALVPSLREASRSIVVYDYYRSWDIEFADLVDHAFWETFVTTLNDGIHQFCLQADTLLDTDFSFEENVLKVSTQMTNECETVFLWPKLTTSERLDYAECCFVPALERLDVLLVIRVLRVLDNTTRMEWIARYHREIILCFLKHPYDRLFPPDLQLGEDDLLHQDSDSIEGFDATIRDTFLKGKFCSDSRNVLDHLWEYFSSRNLDDQLLRDIKMCFNLWEFHEEWFHDEPQNDADEAVYELYQLFHQQVDA